MGKRKSDLRGLHNNRKNADNTKEIWKGDRFMKKMKKLLFMVVFATAATVFVGCGNKEGSSEEMTVDRTEQTTQKGEDKENLMSPGDFGENQEGDMPPGGDGNEENKGGDTTTDNTEGATTEGGDVGKDVGNAVKDAGNVAEDVVDDVADGVGDAIDNLGGGSFDRYEDARKYLLEKLSKDNKGAHYEVREETKDLTSYNHNDSGAEGYKFSVYETDGEEKIGIYYVDKDTGKIYRYMGKNSIESY